MRPITASGPSRRSAKASAGVMATIVDDTTEGVGEDGGACSGIAVDVALFEATLLLLVGL